MRSRLEDWWPNVLRYGGLAGVVYETVGEQLDRPVLLGVFAGMMGLREVIAAQRRRNDEPAE